MFAPAVTRSGASEKRSRKRIGGQKVAASRTQNPPTARARIFVHFESELTMDDVSHLSVATREWFESIVDRYRLSADRKRVLLVAGEMFDRSEECRRQVAADGLLVRDRYTQLKLNPAADAERRAKSLFLQAMKNLALDDVPEPVTGPASKYLSKSMLALE